MTSSGIAFLVRARLHTATDGELRRSGQLSSFRWGMVSLQLHRGVGSRLVDLTQDLKEQLQRETR